jgi:SnoaL-like domain
MLYFELATRSDTDAYFAQFTDDAIVEDEGKERHGINEIRAWRTEVPPVHYDVKRVERDGRSARAWVDISGEFPGSPVTLCFDFDFAPDDRIAVLRIKA